jgi:hypothetical protein
VSLVTRATDVLDVGRGLPGADGCTNKHQCDVPERVALRGDVRDVECCLLHIFWLENVINVCWFHFISWEEGS